MLSVASFYVPSYGEIRYNMFISMCAILSSQEYNPVVILVMGDSHARGCLARLKDKLNVTFNVMGIVKPGTSIKILTSMGRRRTDNLTVSDVIVLWGGTNDISHNNLQEGFNEFCSIR
jgi:hypothetical protein